MKKLRQLICICGMIVLVTFAAAADNSDDAKANPSDEAREARDREKEKEALKKYDKGANAKYDDPAAPVQWICSNHSPAHICEHSDKEDYRAKYGCSGWRVMAKGQPAKE